VLWRAASKGSAQPTNDTMLAQCGRDEISLNLSEGVQRRVHNMALLWRDSLRARRKCLGEEGFDHGRLPWSFISTDHEIRRPGPLNGRSPWADAAHHAREGRRLRSNEFSPSWPLIHEPREMTSDPPTGSRLGVDPVDGDPIFGGEV
jgi:hypothetical protein